MPACDARISRASKPVLLATSTTSSNPMVVFWLDPGASAIRTVMESFIELPTARRAPSEAAAARSSRRERTVAIEHCTSRSNGVILLNQAIHVKLRPHYSAHTTPANLRDVRGRPKLEPREQLLTQD